MHWSILALGSAIAAALVAVFGKIGLQGLDSTLATTVRALVMAAFLVCVSLALGKLDLVGTLTSRAMLFIILSGLAGALSWLLYFWAIKAGPVTGVVGLDRLSVVFALFLSALFLGEAITLKSGLAALLISAGAVLLVL